MFIDLEIEVGTFNGLTEDIFELGFSTNPKQLTVGKIGDEAPVEIKSWVSIFMHTYNLIA